MADRPLEAAKTLTVSCTEAQSTGVAQGPRETDTTGAATQQAAPGPGGHPGASAEPDLSGRGAFFTACRCLESGKLGFSSVVAGSGVLV